MTNKEFCNKCENEIKLKTLIYEGCDEYIGLYVCERCKLVKKVKLKGM